MQIIANFNHKDGSQDVELLVETLQKIPKISEMQKYSSDDQLKVVLDEISPLMFPLLRWIVRSNRTHLELVPKKHQLSAMGTELQFQVVSSFPEHERKFQDWKSRARKTGKKNSTGSYFAFHGSPVVNFHSIIRTGLRGGFVPGIYHAQNAGVSFGYMFTGGTPTKSWGNSVWKSDKNVSCIAMIEVADMRNDNSLITGGKSVSQNTVNVAMDHSLVVTRFLFFYPTGPTANWHTRGPIIAEHQKEFSKFLFGNSGDEVQSQNDS